MSHSNMVGLRAYQKCRLMSRRIASGAFSSLPLRRRTRTNDAVGTSRSGAGETREDKHVHIGFVTVILPLCNDRLGFVTAQKV